MAVMDALTSAQLKAMYGTGNYSYMSGYGVGKSSSSSSASALAGLTTLGSDTKQRVNELADSLKKNNSTVAALKKDTASFLDGYTLSVKNLGQSASKLMNGGIDRMLGGYNGEVTEENVAKTVNAVQDMVTNYNSTLKLLNDNYDRGVGVEKQLSRMVEDPNPQRSMAMVGMGVNKDGSLTLDTEKLTAALTNEDPTLAAMYKDILGGYGGIADNIRTDAAYGSNISANQLVNNDLANINSQRIENPFTEMYASFKVGAFAMSNQAATGMLMNMLA